MTDLLQYLSRWRSVTLRRAPRTSRAQWEAGDSPYKVVLMLSLVNAMHRSKSFRSGIVYYAECVSLFQKCYELLYGDQEPERWEARVVQPFWYFGAGRPRIWILVPKEGKVGDLKQAIVKGKQVKTLGVLNSIVECAEFAPGDFDLLQDRVAARALISFLVTEHLPQSVSSLESLLDF